MVKTSNADILDSMLDIMDKREQNYQVTLVDLIEQALDSLSVGGSDEERKELAPRKTKDIRYRVNEHFESLDGNNVPRIFSWNPRDKEILVKTQLLREDQGELLYPSKYHLNRRIKQFICSEINDGQFEDLCRKIVKEWFGCADVRKTGKKDEGIDVMGKIGVGSENYDALIIVQSKRFERFTNVGVELIREFYGAIDIMIRYKGATGNKEPEKKAKDLGIKLDPLLPIIPFLMASSSFSKPSVNLAEKLGIKLLNGYDLSLILLDLDIGFSQTMNGWKFSKISIERFIQ